ncbi:hypothetical protein BpHYR1_046765 [Brachionus plicatilis]|uniref:Uncharacterized protein n=1 Tax=Brachionus plicatilis TaxID=10195 RepID=A0A3M7PBM8_BRAPC|nr:hypothetical protein BpHYR1_046765 [Brachionus plicatilis]
MRIKNIKRPKKRVLEMSGLGLMCFLNNSGLNICLIRLFWRVLRRVHVYVPFWINFSLYKKINAIRNFDRIRINCCLYGPSCSLI